jgi:hypothetical protein
MERKIKIMLKEEMAKDNGLFLATPIITTDIETERIEGQSKSRTQLKKDEVKKQCFLRIFIQTKLS